MSGGYGLEGVALEFSPLGLFDAVDGTHVAKGACSALINLVHDVTTPNVWVPRPAVTALTGGFSSFSQPQVVSVMKGVGTRVYGMIGTARTPGYDEPFCFDTAISAFVAISGVTGLNVPATQATSGTWTPPQIDVIGSKIVITHPGFSGVGNNFFGIIDISVPAVPAWSAHNTGGTALSAVPTGVVQFNGRAWYIVNNALVFTDSLNPLNVAAGTDVLTLGDAGTAIIALAQQTITQTTGGVIQALTAFKANTGFWQITGDKTGSTLALNGPNAGLGCPSARSAALTPAGVLFAAVDGIRIVLPTGIISDKPIPDVRQVFGNAAVPTRVVAAYNDTVYRVCGTWTTSLGNQKQDYWYDFEINRWSGPHTFTYDAVAIVGAGFVLASNDFPAELYMSTVEPTSSSTYQEIQSVPSPGSAIWGVSTWGAFTWGGASSSVQALHFELESTIFPQRDMQVQSVVESTLDVAFQSGVLASYTVALLDPAGVVLGQTQLNAPTGGTVWGAFTWGGAPWAGQTTGFQTYNLDWSAPIVYKRAQLAITGASFASMRIGSFRARVKAEGYMNVQNPP